MKRALQGAAALAVAMLMSACTSFSPRAFRTVAVEGMPAAEIVYRGLSLNSGVLIVSDAAGADSLLLSLLGATYSPFVHSGILVIENNRPYVYEGFATVDPFFRGPPTAAMQGGIRRVTLERYLSRQRIAAIFEPLEHVDRSRIADFAQARHRDGTPFDGYFDWNDHSRLYCTEFAALALHAGGLDLPQPVPVRNNPSLRIALDWLKVTTPEIVTAETLTPQMHRVALLSRRYSAEQVAAHFAAKQEIHARFTADQKIGNIWRWTWRGLALQPPVAKFLRESREQPERSTEQLALEFFGAIDARTVSTHASPEVLH